MLMRSFLLLLAACCVITTGFVSAHETWLSPALYAGDVGHAFEFDFTSGMNFPTLDYAVHAERISAARYRLNGKEAELTIGTPKKNSLSLKQTFDSPGLVTAWVTLFPKNLKLSEDKVAEYFEEIHASQQLRETWAQLKDHQEWNEIYTKYAKTCVAMGDAKDDSSWKQPVGLVFEIVPLTDPAALKADHPATFQLLQNGQPLANASLGLLAEGKPRMFQTTDAEGRATFPLISPGRVLVFAVDLQLAKNRTHWESKFATFTFEVH